MRRDGVPLGADQRYAYPAFPQSAVTAGATSVQILRQSERTLPAGTVVVGPWAPPRAKAEVVTTTEFATVNLKQMAAIETNIPNVILEQDAIESLVETDVRLAFNEGLDQEVVDAVADSGFEAPGSNQLLISIGNAAGTIAEFRLQPGHHDPPPGGCDHPRHPDHGRRDGIPEQLHVPAGQPAPRTIYGMNTRISSSVAAPEVCDSQAFGKLYISPVTLARFEVDAGSTNRSKRQDGASAAFGVERQSAPIRIAVS